MAKPTPKLTTHDGRVVTLSRVHPARFDVERHLPLFRRLLKAEQQRCPGRDLWVLDPMAGVGTIHGIDLPGVVTVANEIERAWVDVSRQLWPERMSTCCDATTLPFDDATIDAVIVSPSFGNRYRDAHVNRDPHRACEGKGCKICDMTGISKRRSYTHDLRYLVGDKTVTLNEQNSGVLSAKSARYWELHVSAWAEALRVLRGDGLMVVDVKDVVEHGKIVPVVAGHRTILEDLGFGIEAEMPLPAAGLRYGANGDLRVDGHTVIVARKPTAEAEVAA